jgi:glycosyltransferase involved in cell wall biosynthesis
LDQKPKVMIELSVIIPIYNEELIIAELHERLRQTVEKITPFYELIFVNDGSKDSSLDQLKSLAEKQEKTYFVNFSRNFGHQVAVSAGLGVCRGKAVVIIDGDLQDPPELIADLHAKYLEGYEVVYAKRIKREGETFFKKWSAKIFYRLLKKITSVEIPVDVGDFRLIDRKVVEQLKKMPERNKFLRGQIAWIGFRQTDVAFYRDVRKHGETGYSLSQMIHFAMDGITGFSDVPLKLVTRLGITISFVSFLIFLYAIFSHFVLDRTVTGWTSLIISVSFFGGVQLLSLGIIGEYISRINKNAQDRPLYIVESSNMD